MYAVEQLKSHPVLILSKWKYTEYNIEGKIVSYIRECTFFLP